MRGTVSEQLSTKLGDEIEISSLSQSVDKAAERVDELTTDMDDR